MSGKVKQIPEKMTFESTDTALIFTFYCDICGRPYATTIYRDKTAQPDEEHYDAFLDQARKDIKLNFNHCFLCGRAVCGFCFRIPPEGDMCKDCTAARNIPDTAESIVFCEHCGG